MKNQRFDMLSRSVNVETTRRGFLGLAVAAAGVAVSRRTVLAADDRPEQKRLASMSVLERGAEWLQAQQLADGGYPNVRGEPDFSATFDAISALAALRNVGVAVETDAAVAYLEAHAAELNEVLLGREGVIVLPLVAAGADPRDFGRVDLIDGLAASWDAANGRYGAGDPILNYLALLALAGTGEAIPGEAIAAIAAIQIEDGSWSLSGGTDPGSGDSLMTSLAVQVLAAAGHRKDPEVDAAIAYLHSIRDAGGGIGFSPGAPPDTLTTAFVVAALSASGERRTGEKWKPTIEALIAVQNERGAFRYNDLAPGDDILATIAALLALAGGSLPVLPAA